MMTGVYVAAMSRLPNRVYFPNLIDMDDTRLADTLAKLLIYAVAEVASLFVLDWMLRPRLRFSPLAQLAWVLETRWLLMQTQIVLWTFYSVQTSLYHFGELSFLPPNLVLPNRSIRHQCNNVRGKCEQGSTTASSSSGSAAKREALECVTHSLSTPSGARKMSLS